MKKFLVISAMAAASAAPTAYASNVGFDMNINIGNTPQVVVPSPAPVPPPVVIDEPPEFIAPPQLGFHVAVGVPYDMVFIGNTYYLCRNNAWYRAPSYNGPWVGVRYRSLPPGLRRYKMERIRHMRDAEYRVYRGDRDHYRGRYFRPEKEWKERRKEAREERKWEREEHGHGGGHGRHGERD